MSVLSYIIIRRLHRTNIRHIHYTVHTVPSLEAFFGNIGELSHSNKNLFQ